jgi:hypothetical protein
VRPSPLASNPLCVTLDLSGRGAVANTARKLLHREQPAITGCASDGVDRRNRRDACRERLGAGVKSPPLSPRNEVERYRDSENLFRPHSPYAHQLHLVIGFAQAGEHARI